MDPQTLINAIAATSIGAMGWFARQLWDAVKELNTDLAKLREEIAKDYVPKDDFRELAKDLREMLREISNKLDNKADK
jgi:hypothetical protein